MAFPDGNAVYHILFVPKLQGPMDVIRIEGGCACHASASAP